MDTAITNATEYRNLPLALLTESTTNPRRIFRLAAVLVFTEGKQSRDEKENHSHPIKPAREEQGQQHRGEEQFVPWQRQDGKSGSDG